MPKHNPGTYFGRIMRAVVAELGNDKKPAFVLTFDVTHVAQDGGWGDLTNPEQRDVKMFLTEAAWPFTEAKLKSFGFNGDFSKPEFSAEFKQGTELVCTHNGTYENWDFPRGTNEVQPASSDVVRTLNARWKTANGIGTRPAGTPPAPPARRVVHATPTALAVPVTTTASIENDPPF